MSTSPVEITPSRSKRIRLDFGLLMTLALCLLALYPLVARGGLPNGTDVLYHIYRAAEMDRSWSHGVLLPRWAEGLYYGYGSPLFHYYASAAYYLTSVLMRVFSFDALNSLRAVIVICMLGGGAGMYLFMKQRAGQLAGVIAALCYVYSPYLLYTEPYARGDYPELLAFAVFPLVMWRFERLLSTRRGIDALLAALCLALLILSHNLMALVLCGLLILWLLWGIVTGGRSALRSYSMGLFIAGLGVGLAAYFWLPVLLEQGEVKLENLTAVALLDYRNFFVPLSHLLAQPPRADAGAINGLLHQLSVGVAQWALALTGFIGLLAVGWMGAKHTPLTRRMRMMFRSQAARYALFFALLAVVMIFLMLPTSAGIWDAVKPLAYLQFPWRFLGPLAFCLAVLAGMNALWIEWLTHRGGGVIVAGIVVAILALALPLLYVPEWVHGQVDTSIAAYHQSEVSGLQRGTTFTNEYLPKTVAVLADSTSWLLEDYADGYPVNKANRASVPTDATVTLLDNGPQHNLWRVTAETPFKMEVLVHDFAGWQAEIDGVSADITASNPHGFIQFPVPAGEHTVRVFLGSTPARDLGMAVTGVSALGLVAILVLLVGRNKPAGSYHAFVQTAMRPAWRFGLVTGFVLSIGLAAGLMREDITWVKSEPGEALPAQHHVYYNLGDTLQLVGYDLSSALLKPGDQVELVVYWYARAPLPHNYQAFVHLSTGGPPAAQADRQNPGGRPTTTWTSNGYIRDDYKITLPDTMPPGEYRLLVGLYTCETRPAGGCGNGDRLFVTDSGGSPVGDAVLLQTVQVAGK